MLAIQPSSKSAPKCTPNLLPARLNHDGPVPNTARYWIPSTTKSSSESVPENQDSVPTPAATQTVHFRGRCLHGTPIALPSNYTGAILDITEKDLPNTVDIEAVDDDGEEETEKVDVKIAEQVGNFDGFVVWGHGGEVDKSQDAYLRSIGEWVHFAESMHVELEDDGNGA